MKQHSTRDTYVQYASNHSLRITHAQERLIEETLKHRMSPMLGSADELQLLANICKLIRAKKTLDIGVFTGYSALSIALALPEDGCVIACDVSDEYTKIGERFWKEAKVDHKIDLRIAPAAQTLRTVVRESLIDEGQCGMFDFAFIDADKINYDTYYELCLKLVRSGGVIGIDNVLWGGRVIDSSVLDQDTVAIRKLNDKIHTDERVDVSMLIIGDGTNLVFKK